MQMSNKTLFAWGFLVFMLFSGVFLIYVNTKDELKFYPIKDELKVAVKDYLKDNEIIVDKSDGFELTSKVLIDEKYIEPDLLVIEEEVCECNIKVNKHVINFYHFEFNCTNN